jgi:hypothetical protein
MKVSLQPTAEQYERYIAERQASIDQTTQDLGTITQKITVLNNTIASKESQLGAFNAEGQAVVQREIAALQNEVNKAQNYRSQLAAKIDQDQQSINWANQKLTETEQATGLNDNSKPPIDSNQPESTTSATTLNPTPPTEDPEIEKFRVSQISQADLERLPISERNEVVSRYQTYATTAREQIRESTESINYVDRKINQVNEEIREKENQLPTASPAEQESLRREIDLAKGDIAQYENTKAQIELERSVATTNLTNAERKIDQVQSARNYSEDTLPPITEEPIGSAYSDPETQTATVSASEVTEDPIAKLLEEKERARVNAENVDAQAQEAAAVTTAQGTQVRTEGTAGAQKNIKQQEDWRLRLSLSPNANYLYKTAKQGDLLYPLQATSGIVFPYTPQISINYRANYDPSDLTHTNYKYYFYKNSSVDEITITADFTAQDTNEANYVLAATHFFKSVTKMFYGQDGKSGPRAGTPPPLCYLTGYGQFQFNNHPLLISGFQYTLPNDVDYIRAGSTTQWAGQNISAYNDKARGRSTNPKDARRASNNLEGKSQMQSVNSLSNSQATYIPTKIQFVITAVPVATRAEVSNVFSVEKYATGELLRKGYW